MPAGPGPAPRPAARGPTLQHCPGVAVRCPGAGIPSGAEGAASAPVRSITGPGPGPVTTGPARGEISFGVTTDARTATAALNGNAADMVKVINALKAAGVAGTDIQ